jgi:ABC-type branched-subunit amino acid transport system substrate-binding protein
MNRKISQRLAVTVTAVVLMSGALVVASPAATAAPSSSTNGVWPGVGQLCGSGTGGASSVRGVSTKAIDVAVFSDAGNSVQPGLDIEFPQFANAFAKWCNAAGGINGRKLVVHSRDGALFNAGQVMTQACQQDFMSVGGGLTLDTAAVPIRVACGLGQITSYTVSDQAVDAALQVNPNGVSNSEIEAGWYGALAKKYPKAIKEFGIGGENQPSILEQIHKDQQAAVAQGYKVVDSQEPPLSVTDWSPYIEEAQSKGVQALQPSAASNVAPYFQAMQTAGYNPAFVYMFGNLYGKTTAQATASMHLPPTFLALQSWPFELASKSPGLTELDAIMHKYSPGTTIDQNDELAASSWVLFAKSAKACGANLTVSCVLNTAAAQKNWSAGEIQAPTAQLAMSDQNPTPSDCFTMVQLQGGKFSWDKSLTVPNNQIWHCDPKTLFHVSSTGT